MKNDKSANSYIKKCLSDDEIMLTFPVMKQLRAVTEEKYIETIKLLFGEGYHLTGYFSEEHHCVGVVGYNVGHRLHTGKMIYVADLVVDEKFRSFNYGSQLIDWIKQESNRLNCNAIILDSGVQRSSAHKFYFRNGFDITSFNFKYFDKKQVS